MFLYLFFFLCCYCVAIVPVVVIIIIIIITRNLALKYGKKRSAIDEISLLLMLIREHASII